MIENACLFSNEFDTLFTIATTHFKNIYAIHREIATGGMISV